MKEREGWRRREGERKKEGRKEGKRKEKKKNGTEFLFSGRNVRMHQSVGNPPDSGLQSEPVRERDGQRQRSVGCLMHQYPLYPATPEFRTHPLGVGYSLQDTLHPEWRTESSRSVYPPSHSKGEALTAHAAFC